MKVFRKVSLIFCAFVISALLLATTSFPVTFNFGKNDNAVTYVTTAEAKSTDYYEDIDTTLKGTAFRAEVAELITTTHKTKTTYNGLKTIFKNSDADLSKSGNIIWFYTGTSISYNGNLGSGSSATNREHVWPKNAGKAFDPESNCGSDAHHLRPTNAQLNSTRSNNSFGEVAKTNSNIVKENGKTTYPSLCYQANSTFYPGEGFRGATARILMYVQTRWGDTYNLKFVLGNGNNKTIGDIATLLKWHYQEPPTEEEYARNDYVYSIQGNRNPFIDHPEYATQIYCYDGQTYNSKLQQIAAQYDNYSDSDEYVVATELTVTPQEVELTEGNTATLSTTVSPSNAKRAFTYASNNTSVAKVSDNGVITAVKEGTATITVTETYSKLTKTVKVTVTEKLITATAITVTPTEVELEIGNLSSISAEASPTNATYEFTYTSSNPDVVDVDESGTIMGCAVGTATITVTETYSKLTKTVTVTVKDSSATPEAQAFFTLVLFAKSKLGQDACYSYIVKAFNAYKNLTESEKKAVTDGYQTLLDCVFIYNDYANATNATEDTAIIIAISATKTAQTAEDVENAQ